MHFGRFSISILLLLAHSLGFAHNLVPHCQEINPSAHAAHTEKGNHHHHKHHQHSPNEAIGANHDHILHLDHYDAGLIDLVFCFLNEIEHPDNECNSDHLRPEKSNQFSRKDWVNLDLLIVFIATLVTPDLVATNTAFATYLPHPVQEPPLASSPHRGPPSFTC